MLSDPRGRVDLAATLSARDAAQRANISYITLRRWLSRGEFTPPSAGKNGAGGLWLGDSPTRKRIWRFTNADMTALLNYKKDRDLDGRGRAARIREQLARERNRKKAWKRTLRRAGAWRPQTTAERKLYRLLRRYTGILVELLSQGLYPKDPMLRRGRHRLGLDELKILDGIVSEVVSEDRRARVERLGAMIDPRRTPKA
jgi:transposase